MISLEKNAKRTKQKDLPSHPKKRMPKRSEIYVEILENYEEK